MVCESITSPTAADQIVHLDDATAQAVLEAITRREHDPFGKAGRAPDPDGNADGFLDLTVRGIVIRCLMVDNGAAFEVLTVRRYMIG